MGQSHVKYKVCTFGLLDASLNIMHASAEVCMLTGNRNTNEGDTSRHLPYPSHTAQQIRPV